MRDFDERLMKAETSDEVKKLKLWMFSGASQDSG